MAEFCITCGKRLDDPFRLKCSECYQDELDKKDGLNKNYIVVKKKKRKRW